MEEFPKLKTRNHEPAFYDADTVTVLEATAKVYGKLNEVIAEFNRLSDHVNQTLEAFSKASAEERKVFETALRQEFQDFIDTVDLKLNGGEL